jgi:hypothetical protein
MYATSVSVANNISMEDIPQVLLKKKLKKWISKFRYEVQSVHERTACAAAGLAQMHRRRRERGRGRTQKFLKAWANITICFYDLSSTDILQISY